MGATAEQIDYAPGRPRRPWWRRRGVWAALAGLVAVATAVPIYRHRQPLQAKWAQLAFERQCLNYRAPADLVVYTEDPGEFAALLAAAPQPAGGHYRQASDDSFVNFYPDVWVANPLLKWDPGPAFLHRLENSRGETRLVGVDLSPIGDEFWFYPRVVIPAGLKMNARPARTRAEDARLPADRRLLLALGLSRRAGDDVVRVFAGQPGADDPTHFTIRLEVNGVPETVDGWLQDDDLVLLKPRDRKTYFSTEFDAPLWNAAKPAAARRAPRQ